MGEESSAEQGKTGGKEKKRVVRAVNLPLNYVTN